MIMKPEDLKGKTAEEIIKAYGELFESNKQLDKNYQTTNDKLKEVVDSISTDDEGAGENKKIIGVLKTVADEFSKLAEKTDKLEKGAAKANTANLEIYFEKRGLTIHRC